MMLSSVVNREFFQPLSYRAERMAPAPYCIENSRFATSAAALSAERFARRMGHPAQMHAHATDDDPMLTMETVLGLYHEAGAGA